MTNSQEKAIISKTSNIKSGFGTRFAIVCNNKKLYLVRVSKQVCEVYKVGSRGKVTKCHGYELAETPSLGAAVRTIWTDPMVILHRQDQKQTYKKDDIYITETVDFDAKTVTVREVGHENGSNIDRTHTRQFTE